jgi:hypothetical protein
MNKKQPEKKCEPNKRDRNQVRGKEKKQYDLYGYGIRRSCGRREKFLDSMEGVIPWTEFIETIEPLYPNQYRAGRSEPA